MREDDIRKRHDRAAESYRRVISLMGSRQQRAGTQAVAHAYSEHLEQTQELLDLTRETAELILTDSSPEAAAYRSWGKRTIGCEAPRRHVHPHEGEAYVDAMAALVYYNAISDRDVDSFSPDVFDFSVASAPSNRVPEDIEAARLHIARTFVDARRELARWDHTIGRKLHDEQLAAHDRTLLRRAYQDFAKHHDERPNPAFPDVVRREKAVGLDFALARSFDSPLPLSHFAHPAWTWARGHEILRQEFAHDLFASSARELVRSTAGYGDAVFTSWGIHRVESGPGMRLLQ